MQLSRNLKNMYTLLEDEEKYDETEKKILALGGAGDLVTLIGLSINYIVPANIVGGEICIFGAGRIRQKKPVDPITRKKYRACSYEYPLAAGLFALGYERSLDDQNYSAYKFDPVWLNYIFSLHPAQFIYAHSKDDYSYIWRPELGISFSTLSFNYAYNLPLKKSFNVLPANIFSIRFVLPVLKPKMFN